MMTVKHALRGVETIYPAPHGVKFFGDNADFGCGGPHLQIELNDILRTDSYGIEAKALWGGTAYVMNDAGATVGIYHLGDRPTGRDPQSAGYPVP